MPVAVDLIYKLGHAGAEVFAADTFEQAPGGHSSCVRKSFVVPSPRFETAAFVREVNRICEEHHIDTILPCFEEAFHLRWNRSALPSSVLLLTASTETLQRLHSKVELAALAGELGLTVPRTAVVTNVTGLRRATAELRDYVARPTFSRGGVEVLTNRGPLSNRLRIEECEPTATHPWLVQEFIEGTDVCSTTVARGGRISAHISYEHPVALDGAGGVAFESVDAAEALRAARTLAERTGYTGMFGLDFVRERRSKELFLIECNPRPTAGVALLRPEELIAALEGNGEPFVCPAGRQRKIAAGLILDMLMNWRNVPGDLRALLSAGPDLYTRRDDLLPGLYQFLSYAHVLDYRRQMPRDAHGRLSDIVSAQFYDVVWNGD